MAERAKETGPRCRPTWYRDPLAVPRCTGHDEPMLWSKDARKKAGGFWRCAVGARGSDRKRDRTPERRARKREYYRHYGETPRGISARARAKRKESEARLASRMQEMGMAP